MATLIANSTLALKEIVSSHLLPKDKFSFGKTQSTLCGVLQQTFVAAVVVFYSKNVVSAALRALISF
jgi:hypothetical protein